MAHTIATMRTSTKQQRRNRKQTIFERIERQAMKYMSQEQARKYVCSIKSDLHELMEIGHVEGYQCGKNDADNNHSKKDD